MILQAIPSTPENTTKPYSNALPWLKRAGRAFKSRRLKSGFFTLGIAGKINELVVAYKDRLTRFGYELIEEIIKEYSNGKIIILNEKEELGQEEEMVKDVMALMNVYVAKMNGLRKYRKIAEI